MARLAVSLLLLAAAVHADLASDCTRAFRKKEPAQRADALKVLRRKLPAAGRKEKNKAAAAVSKGLKGETSTPVRVAAVEFYLWLGTDRSFDRLVVRALDAHEKVRTRVKEIARDHANARLHRVILRTLEEDASWRMRAAMVDLLLAGARDNAIAPLVAALKDTHPGVASRAAETLERLTGQAFGMDLDAWISYLAKKSAAPKPDPQKESVSVVGKPKKVELYMGPIRGVVPTLYTIPIRAKRVIFVVDMSSSMRASRRSAQFDELKRALFGLPSDVHFNILCFDQRMFFFTGPKSLAPATTEQKAKAERWINDLPAGEQTDVTRSVVTGIAMLREALLKNPTLTAELFVITDGRETATTMPQKQLRSQFERLPADRYKVHLVALGRKGTPALRPFAEESGGQVVQPGR